MCMNRYGIHIKMVLGDLSTGISVLVCEHVQANINHSNKLILILMVVVAVIMINLTIGNALFGSLGIKTIVHRYLDIPSSLTFRWIVGIIRIGG